MNKIILGANFVFASANRRGLHMALSVVLDELDEALTNSSKVAAALDDELLVYLIDMAVLHVRKKAIHTEDDRQAISEGSWSYARQVVGVL